MPRLPGGHNGRGRIVEIGPDLGGGGGWPVLFKDESEIICASVNPG